MISFVMNLYTMTDSIGSSFDALKENQKKVLRKIRSTTDPKVKEEFEYIMKRIELLRPMRLLGVKTL